MHNTEKLQAGQRVVVLGMGVSGRAAVRFLLGKGVHVSVSDSRNFTMLPTRDQEYLLERGIEFEGGGHSSEFLLKADAIVISPGIATDIPVLQEARKQRIPILGELALAAPYLQETVVAVTGTNGKTTVTALIGELLRASGKRVFVGGNIGTPLLDYLCTEEQADVLVLELSSFQLESAGNFRPHIGVLLNVTPDHLDRHGNMVNYASAKMKMFVHQKKEDSAIVCSDDPMCQQVRPLLTEQRVFCFGNYASGCAAQGGKSSITIFLDGSEETTYSLSDTALDSCSGLLNAEAALLAASLLQCKQDDMIRGLHSFVLAPHRLQFVRSIAGVDYYDDSKATNSGAVISALNSFSGNVILIAGGKEKGEDFTMLRESVQEKVKHLILLGEAAAALEAALAGKVLSHTVGSMERAVDLAHELAEQGDVVLLAPACASFDMFDNYGHRGEVFSRAVMNLDSAAEVQAVR